MKREDAAAAVAAGRGEELNKGAARIDSANRPAQVLVNQLIELELETGNAHTQKRKESKAGCTRLCLFIYTFC